jgi:outer membrane biosynthesis protein TonB
MRSLTMRGMSRSVIALTVVLATIAAGSALALAWSGVSQHRASHRSGGICASTEAGGSGAAKCSSRDIFRRPTLIEGRRTSPRHHHAGQAPAVEPPASSVPVSSQPPSPRGVGPSLPPVGGHTDPPEPTEPPAEEEPTSPPAEEEPSNPPVEEEPSTPPVEEEPPAEEEPSNPPVEEEPPAEEEPSNPPVEEEPAEPPAEEEPSTPPVETAGCDQTVSSVSAAQSALGSASSGSVVCLANGTYGGISLGSSKAAPGVTLTAANPGGATIGSVQVNASGYTISRFVINGEVSISRNVDRTVVDHNRILSGGHYGVFVCTAEPPDQCDDTRITGNLFDGKMNEDQIRANVFHDGNGDGVGLLVEGNEFRGNTERGGHNDVFQSVWVGDHLVFRKNYLHDFGGQGFFVKDQGKAIDGFIANDNLIVDQDLPCEPSSLCSGYQLSPWQVYGPIANGEMRHNTVGWGSGGGTAVLTGTYTNIDFSDNVFNRLSDTNGGGSVPSLSGSNNTYCDNSSWGVPPGTSKDCAPAFLDPAAGDYRLANGRGVDWVPSQQHYGP